MQGNYYLFLDDIRNPNDVTWETIPFGVNWTILRSYSQFVTHIERHGLPIFVTFDHDLADEHYPQSSDDYLKPIDRSKYKEKTGYECAKWMIDFCEKHNRPFPEFRCHSFNPVGKKNIIDTISAYKIRKNSKSSK